MDRRLFTFIIASTAFFLCYMTLLRLFGPPPKDQANQDPAAEVAEDGEPKSTDPSEPETSQIDQVEPAESTESTEPEPERQTNEEWYTLGSMDPTTGHHLLVTLSNKGGGVERIELTARKENGELEYRRVDVRRGYLGYLAPSEDVDGVKVNVIGPGTPADIAGLQKGDVIVAIAGNAVAKPSDLDKALAESRPDDTVTVEVLRNSVATPTSEGEQPETTSARGPPTLLKATLSQHPLDLVRLAKYGGDDQIVGNLSRLSCLLTLGQVDRKGISTGESVIRGLNDPTELHWDAKPASSDNVDSIDFSLEMSAGEMKEIGAQPVRLHRSYSLAPGSYSIDMVVEVENLADQPQRLAYRLEGANGITLEGWWYSNKISPNTLGGAAARDIVYYTAAEKHELISGFDLLKKAKKDPNDPDQRIFSEDLGEDSRNMKYIAVDAQYFTVGYVPPTPGSSLTTFRRASAGLVANSSAIARHKERAVNCSFFLDSQIADVAPGQRLRQELRLFAGPKTPELLAQYELGDCIYYGWFSVFSKLLASLLHILSAVGNYGIAIIILTVIVRAGMFPLSRKAAVNAQRMQELAPELKKIADQYKDDMEGRLKAQRELQQRVGFNPLAGCLPMFLQLPIFIGLYRALSVDIELRGEPLAGSTGWASNLAGPDMFSYWGDWMWEYLSGRGTGWLGPYFNILPVAVVILFLAQQKMFMPPATDDQTRMTQKMMTVMTMMMGLFFFRVPAGLCIYFITSSLWGICERILVKKTLPSTPHFDSAVIEGTAKPSEKKSTADKLMERFGKTEAPVERPNKRRRPNTKKKK